MMEEPEIIWESKEKLDLSEGLDISEVGGISEYEVVREFGKSGEVRGKAKEELTAGDDDRGKQEGMEGAEDSESLEEEVRAPKRWLYRTPEGKVFLVVNKNTVECRCDQKLGGYLREKYESVMESRYFGRGGIEIVNSGQLEKEEVEDLVRLSYNLSVEK